MIKRFSVTFSKWLAGDINLKVLNMETSSFLPDMNEEYAVMLLGAAGGQL
jgi:hypothetical protein